jgi:RNA polymerase sigma-70 factor (ECF subfamily)
VARLRAENPGSARAEYPSDVAELLALGPIERAVLYLHDIEGLSFDEVADLVGIRPGAARVTASRARRKLRTLLEEEER